MDRERRSQRRTDAPDPGSYDVGGNNRGQRRTSGSDAAPYDVDHTIARLATAQDGVVARGQLNAAGIAPHAIDHRVATGRLHVRHRGVYAVGHAALSDRGELRAALLAAGDTAALSHRTAGHLLVLLPSMPPFVEVSVTTRARRSRDYLVIHQTKRAPDTIILDGFPVTAALRTLADLARVIPPYELQRACAAALVRGLVTEAQLHAARLIPADEIAPMRSELERRFKQLARDAALPRPLVNATVGPYEVDALWPAERVVVEVDGWSTHRTRVAFEHDRAQDADLVAQGYAVLRFTWRQLEAEPLVVAARLASVLAVRRRSPRPRGPAAA